MTFANYLNQSWNEHGSNAKAVADNFVQGLSLVQTNDELNQLVGLVTHVMGEHLREWERGVEILSGLRAHPSFALQSETEKSIKRSIAVLRIGAGDSLSLDEFSSSDQIRILAVTASALVETDSKRAFGIFHQALDLASKTLGKTDPANRALAITGNNLASHFEEKKDRTTEENRFMILAAQTARKFWEMAGTWLEVERAEYRLTKTYLQANEIAKAFEHAQAGLEICQDNKAEALEMFFQYEALALVEKNRKNDVGFKKALDLAKQYFDQLSPNDQSWCEPTLSQLESL